MKNLRSISTKIIVKGFVKGFYRIKLPLRISSLITKYFTENVKKNDRNYIESILTNEFNLTHTISNLISTYLDVYHCTNCNKLKSKQQFNQIQCNNKNCKHPTKIQCNICSFWSAQFDRYSCQQCQIQYCRYCYDSNNNQSHHICFNCKTHFCNEICGSIYYCSACKKYEGCSFCIDEDLNSCHQCQEYLCDGCIRSELSDYNNVTFSCTSCDVMYCAKCWKREDYYGHHCSNCKTQFCADRSRANDSQCGDVLWCYLCADYERCGYCEEDDKPFICENCDEYVCEKHLRLECENCFEESKLCQSCVKCKYTCQKCEIRGCLKDGCIISEWKHPWDVYTKYFITCHKIQITLFYHRLYKF